MTINRTTWDIEAENERNRNIIEEYRANAGKFEDGRPRLILGTTGAKSGKKYQNPLLCLPHPDGNPSRLVIIASKGGFPKNPDWYYNLVAHPDVTVEFGAEQFNATAVVQQGEERDRLFKMWSEKYPRFAEFQRNIPRVIPMVVLERK